MIEWNETKEIMPDKGQSVIAACQNGFMIICGYEGDNKWKHGTDSIFDGIFDYWMPLPDIPPAAITGEI